MRIKTAILLIFALYCGTLTAQNTAIGARVPRVQTFKPKIEKGKFLYLGFVHSPSRPCEISAPKVLELTNNNEVISAALFTRERQGECKQWLIDIFSAGCQVQMGADEIFLKYGIEYAPFGVIIDCKRKVLWQGNPQTLDKSKIENIIQQWTSQR